jgi:multisubunit Na+/H+ antiporter MnhF subunit
MSRARQVVIAPVLWAAAIVPPLWILVLLFRLSVNVPFEDDWDSVSVATSWRSGVYTFDEFWQQQSEHRTVFLRLLIWLVSRLTDFNVVAEMMAGFVFALVTLLVFHSLFRAAFEPQTSQRSVILTLISSMLLFSLVQYEIWFSGTASLQLHLVNLCTLTLVWLLTQRAHRQSALFAAMACATAAMFSEASGVLLWVTGAVAIAVTARDRIRREMIWASGAALSLATYAHGLHWSGPVMTANLAHPLRLAMFAAACLGLPFSFGANGASSAAVGLAGCVTLSVGVLYLIRRPGSSMRPVVPFMLLTAHAMLVAILIALGRSERGLQTAMLSHYAFVATIFWIATFAVLAACFWSPAPEPAARGTVFNHAIVAAAVVLLGVRYATANIQGYQETYARSRNLQMAVASLRAAGEPSREVLQMLYPPDYSRIRGQIAALRSLRTGPFATRADGILTPVSQRPDVASPTPASDGFVDGGTCEGVTGWAWEPSQPDSPLALDLWTGDVKLGTVTANWFRRDLYAAGQGNGAHAFRFTFPEPLPPETGRVISVTYAGTSRHLRGSPTRVTCRFQ